MLRKNSIIHIFIPARQISGLLKVMTDNEFTSGDWLLKEAMAYLAYGAIKQLNEPPEKGRKKFTGKEFDEEGGINLSYFGKRYYDQEIGLWISCDPNEQFYNSYAYAANGTNPITFVDDDGGRLNFATPQMEQSFNFGIKNAGNFSAGTLQRIEVLRKSDLTFNINYGSKTIIDFNAPQNTRTIGGGYYVNKTGADITFSKGDVSTLVHELAGHGFQHNSIYNKAKKMAPTSMSLSDVMDASGQAFDGIYKSSKENMFSLEVDAHSVSNQKMDVKTYEKKISK